MHKSVATLLRRPQCGLVGVQLLAVFEHMLQLLAKSSTYSD
jgi:hypothetical protein